MLNKNDHLHRIFVDANAHELFWPIKRKNPEGTLTFVPYEIFLTNVTTKASAKSLCMRGRQIRRDNRGKKIFSLSSKMEKMLLSLPTETGRRRRRSGEKSSELETMSREHPTIQRQARKSGLGTRLLDLDSANPGSSLFTLPQVGLSNSFLLFARVWAPAEWKARDNHRYR